MENIKRKIRLFFVSYGKLLFKIVGTILLIILIIQGLNQYTILQNKEKEQKMVETRNEREEKKKKKESIENDKIIITQFINYCNNKDISKAYELISEKCKQEKYLTIKDFDEKYINKIFNKKRECQIFYQDDNTYKIFLLEDALQAGATENRNQIEDYYTVEENVLGERTININLYNNI